MKSIDVNGHVHEIREISWSDQTEMDRVADLHIELLGFGPMAGLGRRFIREACYVNNMLDGQLQVAVYEIDGVICGFVAYTDKSISFHRSSLKAHWLRTSMTLLVSLIEKPSRIKALWRALAVLGSRRSEHNRLGADPMGEIVCIAVQPAFLKAGFRHASGARPGTALVEYSAQRLVELGVDEMRMIVDTGNKPVLFMYKAMGARFEPYEQGGEPQVLVWFDVEDLVAAHQDPWS